jgi:hypothetical protein
MTVPRAGVASRLQRFFRQSQHFEHEQPQLTQTQAAKEHAMSGRLLEVMRSLPVTDSHQKYACRER